MATKTAVCPECGSPAAPGRFACSECGAMLAAVGPAPRAVGRAAVSVGADDLPPGTGPDVMAESAAADVADPRELDDSSGWETAPPTAAPTPAVDVVAPADELLGGSVGRADRAPVEVVTPTDEPAGPPPGGVAPFDENAPLAAASLAAIEPDVLHELPEAQPADGDAPFATAPSWPPPGDRGPLAAPEPRTPAGAYLPPSAVLPPLDAPAGTPAGSGVVGTATAAPSDAVARSSGSGSTATSWADRSSAALTDALGNVRVTADASRRAIAAGAGLAAIGTLLPWVNTLPGASPLANYLERWGLAAAGVWLVLAGLVVLAGIAGSSGRAATWPIGLPAIATAAFVAGLIWPYAVAGSARSIGVWVVAVGAVVLGVGGILERRARHERGDATV